MRRFLLFTALLATAAGCNLFSGTERVDDAFDEGLSDVAVAADVARPDVGPADDANVGEDMRSLGDGSICVPESDVELCARLVVNCDVISAEDNCGTIRTASCGSCMAPATCGGGGTPNVCACADQTDTEFCAAESAVCGGVTAVDVCGQMRTVSCGTCAANEACVAGVCECVPETDVELCAANAAECGTLNATDRCLNMRTAACPACPAMMACIANECEPVLCPNGTCDASEDAASCPQDCGAVSLAAGQQHTCAVRADGSLLCWGGDSDGQLGVGGVAVPQPPMVVSFGAGVIVSAVVAAGTASGWSTCAVTNMGLYCWGDAANGQLGTGGANDASTPQSVATASVLVSGVGSTHKCYGTSTDTYCWGDAQYGRIGTGNETDRTMPTLVTALTTGAALDIGAGDRHTCFLLAGGTVECVGSNLNGQQGNGIGGSGNFNLVGEDVGLTDVERIVAGHDHNCAVVDAGAADDEVWCWGLNADGQVGNGMTSNQLSPVMVGTSDEIVDLAAGTAHTCTVDEGGAVRCWGQNGAGQLGLSGSADRTVPTLVPLSFVAIGVTAGHQHSCAIDDVGRVWCWGSNSEGQLGDPAAGGGSVPMRVTGF